MPRTFLIRQPTSNEHMRQILRYSDIKFLVFDFDGTLVESNKIKEMSFFRIASQVPNGDTAMAAVYCANGLTRQDIWRRWITEMGLDMSHYDRFLHQYSSEVDELVARAPAIEGAVELLLYLQTASVKVFLSSATPEKNLKAIVAERGWSAFFQGIYGSPRRKAETLRDAVLPLAEAPEFIAVVGDGEDDRLSAEQVGCHFFPVGRLSAGLPVNAQYNLSKIRSLLSEG